jgi:hypothetical protein
MLSTPSLRRPERRRNSPVESGLIALFIWRPQGDSNPRYRRERAAFSVLCGLRPFVSICRIAYFDATRELGGFHSFAQFCTRLESVWSPESPRIRVSEVLPPCCFWSAPYLSGRLVILQHGFQHPPAPSVFPYVGFTLFRIFTFANFALSPSVAPG